MSPERIHRDLDAIKGAEDFAFRAAAAVGEWEAAGFGVEAVEPILRFMEAHSEIDFGPPGALVHFSERFHQRGYEQLLLDSMARRPTPHTAWMLNRLINGTRDRVLRGQYQTSMEKALAHPLADAHTVEQIRDFLSPD
jgi:hypothetical protein